MQSSHMLSGPASIVLLGRDHPELGLGECRATNRDFACGSSAGALAKIPPTADPNEDAVAIVAGPRASLIVVADAHNGRDASELVVEHVLKTLGDDPPPADLQQSDLLELIHGAHVAVQLGTTSSIARHVDSRTTLAVALVTEEMVQWASFGDSCIILASVIEGRRLDTPRTAYLGYSFTRSELEALTGFGRSARRPGEAVVVSTDGFVNFGAIGQLTVEETVSLQMEGAEGALSVVRRLIDRSLANGARDAVTVAVVSPVRSVFGRPR